MVAGAADGSARSRADAATVWAWPSVGLAAAKVAWVCAVTLLYRFPKRFQLNRNNTLRDYVGVLLPMVSCWISMGLFARMGRGMTPWLLSALDVVGTMSLCLLPNFARVVHDATQVLCGVLVLSLLYFGAFVHNIAPRYLVSVTLAVGFIGCVLVSCKSVVFINKKQVAKMFEANSAHHHHKSKSNRKKQLLLETEAFAPILVELRSIRKNLQNYSVKETERKLDHIIRELDRRRAADPAAASGAPRIGRLEWLAHAQDSTVPNHAAKFFESEITGGREVLLGDFHKARHKTQRSGRRETLTASSTSDIYARAAAAAAATANSRSGGASSRAGATPASVQQLIASPRSAVSPVGTTTLAAPSTSSLSSVSASGALSSPPSPMSEIGSSEPASASSTGAGSSNSGSRRNMRALFDRQRSTPVLAGAGRGSDLTPSRDMQDSSHHQERQLSDLGVSSAPYRKNNGLGSTAAERLAAADSTNSPKLSSLSASSFLSANESNKSTDSDLGAAASAAVPDSARDVLESIKTKASTVETDNLKKAQMDPVAAAKPAQAVYYTGQKKRQRDPDDRPSSSLSSSSPQSPPKSFGTPGAACFSASELNQDERKAGSESTCSLDSTNLAQQQQAMQQEQTHQPKQQQRKQQQQQQQPAEDPEQTIAKKPPPTAESALFSPSLQWNVRKSESAYMQQHLLDWNYGPGGLFERLEDPEMPLAFQQSPLTTTFVESTLFFGCAHALGIEGDYFLRMIRYMDAIEKLYYPCDQVLYHNALHATDVLHAAVNCMAIEDIRGSFPDQELSCLAFLFSAAVHDVGHPGKNQAFLVKTQSKLAILFSDRSVLEHHHLAVAFATLREREDQNFLEILDHSDVRLFREKVIQMVLSTDLSLHLENFNNLKDLLASSRPLSRASKSAMELSPRGRGADENLHSLYERDSNVVLCGLIHCCDISNVAKDWSIYRRWIPLIFGEFFAQGDEERTLGLDVAPGNDREVCHPCEMQTYFVNLFVKDLFSSLGEWCPQLGDILVPNVTKNLRHLQEHHRVKIQHMWDNLPPGIVQEYSVAEDEAVGVGSSASSTEAPVPLASASSEGEDPPAPPSPESISSREDADDIVGPQDSDLEPKETSGSRGSRRCSNRSDGSDGSGSSSAGASLLSSGAED
ncbi:5'-cyclic phosphodiesterase 4C [Durusdinium trenchii]|uniref:Phosphodiesterase n=1 Tax=Durusdinium trenchii TaxID=1381693 RepID=A0ABP0KRX1_9DINO